MAKSNQQSQQQPIVTDDDPLMTVSEVAELYRVRANTVYLWIQTKVLPAVRTPGGGIRVRRSHIAAIVGLTASA